MITTIIIGTNGLPMTHIGTSGFTVTGKREGNQLHIQIEVGGDIEAEEAIALIGSFLTHVESLQGEDFVVRCLQHYAQETQKKIVRVGEEKIAILSPRQQKLRRHLQTEKGV